MVVLKKPGSTTGADQNQREEQKEQRENRNNLAALTDGDEGVEAALLSPLDSRLHGGVGRLHPHLVCASEATAAISVGNASSAGKTKKQQKKNSRT